MNYLKRSRLYLTHKKGQSLLMLLIMSAILVFVLSGIIIQNAAISATNNVTKSAGTTITVSADRDKQFSKMRSSSSTTKTLTTPTVANTKIKQAGNLSTVAYYNITNTASVNASSFDAVSTSTGTSSGGMGGGMQPGGTTASAGDISVSGVSSTAHTTTFTSNEAKLVSGRNITASDANTKNVVIEKELATDNSLKVGDSITVKTTATSAKSIKLKVVGIYKAKTSSTAMPGNDPSNTIYTSYTLPASISGTVGKSSAVTYTLENSAKEKTTTKQIKNIIDSSSFSVSSDDASYQQLLQPMKNVQSFAKKIVWLVAIAGTIILGLIIILSVRTRQREIGVLVSLGESKLHIVGQLFAEMLTILIGAMVVALLLGGFVGNKVGNQLLSQQQTTSVATTSSTNGAPSGAPSGNMPGGQTGGGMRGGAMMGQTSTSAANKKALKTLNTSITPSSVIKLGGMGLVIIALAVCISAVSILRLRPKDILSGE
ncbi:ABC transporter permease [Loigolactobacillus zhaoyuanensis]|uniref:ABC transporter permease n=1 Tax=Loigolactobacillus zhaoyuanensis TaxID=2486017 RepID=A0ABW8UIB4_9LACO|nr:ABC transporter permease [Loigolactobacillus zhaoyuanensis]